MRWQDLRQSTNIEDRRGMGRGLAIGGGGLGAIIIAIAAFICSGGDLRTFLEVLQTAQPEASRPETADNREPQQRDQNRQFVGAVMGSLEDTWRQVLPKYSNARYQDPKLVLFTGQVSSACGYGSAAMGPFYCPGDSNLYLDFAFFDELRREFKAPGDFAQAYVIAHEFGHHIQNLTGIMSRVQRQGQNRRLSVALELQADCYAGVWAYYAQRQGVVEPGDAEEAIRAAQAVGDDVLQRKQQGYVVPDSFTHGSARERMQWLTRGMQTGDMRQCETFR